MKQGEDTNYVTLNGCACGAPVFSHNAGGKNFYNLCLSAERLSGREDVLNTIIGEELNSTVEINAGTKLKLTGAMRSCNHLENGRSRLILSVLARELTEGCGEPENKIVLTGTICKPPIYRVTPLGRELCDVMLAVRRRYGKSDFLPLIFWGKNAKFVNTLSVGTKIACEGRVQSREYIKKTEQGDTMKTAFEVSVSNVDILE